MDESKWNFEWREGWAYCPLIYDAREWNGPVLCYKEKCAWYMGGRCAVAVLADRLTEGRDGLFLAAYLVLFGNEFVPLRSRQSQ